MDARTGARVLKSMKRKSIVLFCILFLLYNVSAFLFAFESIQANDELLDKLIDYKDKIRNTWYFQIDKDYNLLLINHYKALIINSENNFRESELYIWTDEDFGQKLSSQIEKYRLKPFYAYVIDLSFDEQYDFLNYGSGGMCLGFEIYKDTDDIEYLFDYHRSLYTFEGIEIKFCIINGKRGFVFSEPKKYENNKSGFYYWSSSEQKYILDESVNKEQIKKVVVPEDYFAYNGLKFSKLDSKLTAEDLSDLDKAQLRLMRNAVYARHGRTFKSVDLQSLWECYAWYKKNPNYSDDLLTETDKYNIEIIKSYENR